MSSIQVERYPVWPTVVLLTLGAMLGVLWGGVVFFAASLMLTAVGGPLAWLLLLPLILASTGFSIAVALFATPIWALVGGWFFAGLASGGGGSVARQFGVTYLSEGHPIAETTQRLARELGLSRIAHVCWYDAKDINAFAMGKDRDNALIAVSKGAVENLTKDQLDAVIAHELGHVANNDMARMTYAHGIRNALTFFLVFQRLKKAARWVFTPLSELELLRFSRAREFRADAVAARLTSPAAMISALETLRTQGPLPNTRDIPTVLLYAGLNTDSWFSTHPPLQERIWALQRL